MFENFILLNKWTHETLPSLILNRALYIFSSEASYMISSKLQRIQITQRIVKIGPFWTYSEERSPDFYIKTMHIIFLLQRSVRYKVNKPKATSSKGTTQPRQHCQKCFHQSVQTQCSRMYHRSSTVRLTTHHWPDATGGETESRWRPIPPRLQPPSHHLRLSSNKHDLTLWRRRRA